MISNFSAEMFQVKTKIVEIVLEWFNKADLGRLSFNIDIDFLNKLSL